MQIAVIGLGYVGLVTAACLARLGHDVVGLEVDERRLQSLLDGGVPYYEPGMDAEVSAQRSSGRLRFSDNATEALRQLDLILICVGTPSDAAGRADLRYVLDVADTIADKIDGSPVIVLRSTVPVGTTRRVERRLNDALTRRGMSREVAVVANPEFLRTGRAIDDFLRPTRIVLGRTELATDTNIDIIRELYRSIDAPLIVTDAESAELVKNASNAFLATKISFVNELAQLCEATGASIDDVVAGVSADPRIGGEFFRPGLGYGGSCLPKDVRSLIAMGSEHGQPMGLANAVDAVNRDQPIRFVRALEKAVGGDLTGRKVAVLGLSFKPETDDIRDSPALAFARALRDRGAHVVGCDPVAADRVREVEPWLEIAESPLAAAHGAEAVVLATEWPAYVTLDPAALAASMAGTVLLDGRNVLDPNRVRAAGLTYVAIGRSETKVRG
jgi:UDPglucose 6-dehydrogenase